MLIGKDDISNDVITPGTCFSMFAYIRADWRKYDSSVEGKPQGNWRWNSNSRDVVGSITSRCSGKWARTHPSERAAGRVRFPLLV